MIVGRSDRYINYDPDFLRRRYAAEKLIAPALPYVEVCSLLPASQESRNEEPPCMTIHATDEPFRLAPGSPEWQQTVATGFLALLDDKRLGFDSPMVRVTGFQRGSNALMLEVQRASYFDQAKSNLIMDFDRGAPGKNMSLRQLQSSTNGSLPTLSDHSLANTLGAAVMVYYWSEENWVPYLVRRAVKVGVFPGGVHCTASGAVGWQNDGQGLTFDSLCTAAIRKELKEEVGLVANDFYELCPIAFCRELARGGKPQLFFGAKTDLTREQLKERRIRAAKPSRMTGNWEEIERDRWYRSADVVMSPERLNEVIIQDGITLEGAAALFYGNQYLEIYPDHRTESRAE